MVWEEEDFDREEIPVDFDFLSLLSKPKDYYRILEVDYDATEETIRSNYIHLALKWHPDKRKGEDGATSRFQEINEAYKVLSDPVKRREHDSNGVPSPVQGPDLDVQWPWGQTFNLVNWRNAAVQAMHLSSIPFSPYKSINIMHAMRRALVTNYRKDPRFG